MNNEKKEILQRLVARISTGLSFVEMDYLPRHEHPDAAWIRNIYILISFYTELLLKAIYIINNDFESVEALDNHLRKLGHNLEKIGAEITKADTSNFGVKKIVLQGHEYLLQTEDGNFLIQDFTDIRYDFIDGRIHTLNGNEHELFKQQIEIMLKINGKLKAFAWN